MAHTQDDGFHEIQLNGKQLVFLFMAATVVSVVIFLCGVLVGRGVRAERGGTENAALTSAVDTPPPSSPAAAPPPAGSDPTAAAPPPAVDDLTYFNRLQKSAPPNEQLKGEKTAAPPAGKALAPDARVAAPSPRVSADASARPADLSAASATKEPLAASATKEPPGQGYAVQIAALNVRSEADAIAKRLSQKGYAAYVLPPAPGTPQVYRVRIGKFGSRREADTIAAKLQKEEQFKPWVTR